MTSSLEVLVHVEAPSAASDDARYRALVASCLAFDSATHVSIFHIPSEVNVNQNENFPPSTEPLSVSTGEVSFGGHHDTSFSHRETSFKQSTYELSDLLVSDNSEDNHPDFLKEGDNAVRVTGLQSLTSLSIEEDSELSFQALIPLASSTNEETLESCRNIPFTPKRNAEPTPEQSATWETPLEVIPDSQNPGTQYSAVLDSSVQVERSFVADSILKSGGEFGTSRNRDDDEAEDADITRIPSSIPSPSPRDSSAAEIDTTHGSRPSSIPKVPKGGVHVHAPTSPGNLSGSSVLGKRKPQPQATTSHPHNKTEDAQKQPSDGSAKKRFAKRSTLPPAPKQICLDTLPLEIRAPDPPVSNERFQTHITPTLKTLAERMNPPSRFAPSLQTRSLQPLERGYWFIPGISIVSDEAASTEKNCLTIDVNNGDDDPSRGRRGGRRRADVNASGPNVWTQSFFSQFWQFLSDFISEGRAGWGIWCLLEESYSPSSSSPSSASSSSKSSSDINAQTFKTANLKIYTWGEVVSHIYLVLFLATERRIKKMPSVEWRDASDTSVVIM